jgi:methylmalonyl-CoA mutase C-terminal domain/subunit
VSARSEGPDRRVRVLVAKPGLDGHDVGAKVVCRALMDAGMEVVYTGLRQSTEAITSAIVAEDPDVLGLSILSGAHLSLCSKLADALRAANAKEELLWVVGGNIPRRDIDALRALGVDAVFPTGSSLDEMVAYLRAEARS